MKKGDLVRVSSGPNAFLNMMGIITDVYPEEKISHMRGRLIVDLVEVHDMGGDSYSFYQNALEVLSESTR